MKVFVKEEIRMVEFDVGCIAALTAALERSFGKFQVFVHPPVSCFSKANDLKHPTKCNIPGLGSKSHLDLLLYIYAHNYVLEDA